MNQLLHEISGRWRISKLRARKLWRRIMKENKHMKTVTTNTPLAKHFFPFAKIGMRLHASVIIAAITLAAAGPAGAFPTCIEEVNNPQLRSEERRVGKER